MDNKITTIVINDQEYNLYDSELRDLVHQMMKIIVNNNNTLTEHINDLNNRLEKTEDQIEILSLKENQILCKYNVTSTSSATTLCDSSYSSNFSSMEVDGIKMSPTSSYTFDTTGEHIVKFTLANNVTSISDNAFSGCSRLTSITIPDSVTSIGIGVLSYCSSLTSINVAANNQTYDSRNNCNAIIETSTNTLIAGCKDTIIPNSVTSIGHSAFSGCSGLTNVTIPDLVTLIDYNAFYDCSGLTNIICNATIAPTIQSNTFQNIKTNGTLTVLAGSTGYDVWMGISDYYLGMYNWTKIEYYKSSPYNLLDILYSDANGNLYVYNTVLPISEGKIPIGLCVASTGFFGENEPARWMSLKYMNYTTPETGSINGQNITMGQYGVDIANIPNISKTYVNGSNYGCLTADWITSTDSNIPSLFTENNNWNISVLGTVNEFAVTDIDGKTKTNKWLEAVTAQPNWQTDSTITNNTGEGYSPAACCCAKYHTLGTSTGDWYLGAGGEISIIAVLRDEINTKLQQINAVYPNDCIASLSNTYYWTSTEYSNNNLYRVSTNNGNVSYRTKIDYSYVIAMLTY